MTTHTNTTVTLSAIIEGHIVHGRVSFSPALEPGIMTELAQFDAERLLHACVKADIQAGRL